MKILIVLFVVFYSLGVLGQAVEQKDSLSLVFIGDIMGHDPQIKSTLNPETGIYDYNSVFEKVSPIIADADFAIANLEVTLAGKPYKGYPQFSSPDALASACKYSGIDVLVTANNHSCDRGKQGILRTINVLDSLEIKHTGTFRDTLDKEVNNLLVLDKNNIKIGLLNYTYGTNGLKAPKPTLINRIDTLKMLDDISKGQGLLLDKLIVVIHWGIEYQSYPSGYQIKIADFLFENGVDIIVGSHPHVLQRMEYTPREGLVAERFVAYSLGNFVSNQRTRKRDGGAILKLELSKEGDDVKISNSGYYLTWVHKAVVDGKTSFEVVPCSAYESDNFDGMDPYLIKKMKLFIEDSRTLFDEENVNIEEITINANN